ncbi:FHA domain protein [Enhygromyxa salina]|uniref:FHA domain protein n=1 Tax=Enhygromyxa salina TaxID=215803 RepID=A0A2S9XCX9_9BACT|nr:FHA domain-containing protein [Enhygromyxa salina]PRP90717.1 FHA domain protein [Enhygromyxa salina]
MPQWSLELRSGARIKLTRGVTTIGRSSRCDIVIPDPAVSRRQALLTVRDAGVELINLGRQALTVANADADADADADVTTMVGDGVELHIGGQPFAVVRRERDPGATAGPSPWGIRVDGGPLLTIPIEGLTLGGPHDDVDLPAWTATTLVLHRVADLVVAELRGELDPPPPFDAEGFTRLAAGATIELADATIELVEVDEARLEQSTRARSSPRRHIKLERFDAGGMLTYEHGADSSSVYLATRRFALVEALLTSTPDDGYHSVDELCRRIWPDDPIKDRADFNVLLYRVRRDFVRAGIDVDTWFERKRGSGMIRAPIMATPGLQLQREGL